MGASSLNFHACIYVDFIFGPSPRKEVSWQQKHWPFRWSTIHPSFNYPGKWLASEAFTAEASAWALCCLKNRALASVPLQCFQNRFAFIWIAHVARTRIRAIRLYFSASSAFIQQFVGSFSDQLRLFYETQRHPWKEGIVDLWTFISFHKNSTTIFNLQATFGCMVGNARLLENHGPNDYFDLSHMPYFDFWLVSVEWLQSIIFGLTSEIASIFFWSWCRRLFTWSLQYSVHFLISLDENWLPLNVNIDSGYIICDQQHDKVLYK